MTTSLWSLDRLLASRTDDLLLTNIWFKLVWPEAEDFPGCESLLSLFSFILILVFAKKGFYVFSFYVRVQNLCGCACMYMGVCVHGCGYVSKGMCVYGWVCVRASVCAHSLVSMARACAFHIYSASACACQSSFSCLESGWQEQEGWSWHGRPDSPATATSTARCTLTRFLRSSTTTKKKKQWDKRTK